MLIDSTSFFVDDPSRPPQVCIPLHYYDFHCLTLHRGVFPNVTWIFNTFDPSNPETSYDSFMKGASKKPNQAEGNELVRWRVPTRGDDFRMDKLIRVLVRICIPRSAVY